MQLEDTSRTKTALENVLGVTAKQQQGHNFFYE